MTWEDVLKEVTYLGSYDLKKFMGPRELLVAMQEIVGGEIGGALYKGGANLSLSFSKGHLKIKSRGQSEYFISLNGTSVAQGFNLSNLLPIVEKELKELYE